MPADEAGPARHEVARHCAPSLGVHRGGAYTGATSRRARRRARRAPWRPPCASFSASPGATGDAHREDEEREEGDQDEAGVRDHLVVRLAPPALAAVVGERGRRVQGHAARWRAGGSGRSGASASKVPSASRNVSRDRIGPRQGHGGHAPAPGRLLQARAPRPADALGPQRLGQDDAAADARGGDVGGRRAAHVRQGRPRQAPRPAPAARPRPLPARLRARRLRRPARARGAAGRAGAEDGRGRPLRDGRLRPRAGAPGARRRLHLARRRQRDPPRPRLPRRAPRPRSSRRSPAAS